MISPQKRLIWMGEGINYSWLAIHNQVTIHPLWNHNFSWWDPTKSQNLHPMKFRNHHVSLLKYVKIHLFHKISTFFNGCMETLNISHWTYPSFFHKIFTFLKISEPSIQNPFFHKKSPPFSMAEPSIPPQFFFRFPVQKTTKTLAQPLGTGAAELVPVISWWSC